jgi:GPI transamidase subunit PIG-U
MCISGQSPYERSTYRYPPILALLVTPNFFLFPEWGKLLFSIADVGIVYLIYAIRNELDVKRQGIESASRSFHSDADSVCSEDNNDIELTFQHSSGDMGSTPGTGGGGGIGGFRSSDVTPPNGFSDSSNNNSSSGNSKYDATAFSNMKITGTVTSSGSSSNMNSNNYGMSGSNDININDNSSRGSGRGEGRTVAWFWALNPLAINICTRGSADSITNCMVLALLYLLMQQSKHTHLILSYLILSYLILSSYCIY